jgi:hypothetical protein
MPLRRLLLILLLAGLAVAPVRAQERAGDGAFTLVLRGVPVAEALETWATLTQINLVYDADLTREGRVFCVRRDAAAEDLLRCVLAGTGLDFYRTSSGTYILQRIARRAPRYERLAGRVVDARTGEPLPQASVMLADAEAGTATNDAGLFSLARLLPGPHRVVTTYVGYEPRADSVWVPPGGAVRRQIALAPRAVATQPVVVNALARRAASEQLGAPAAEAGALAQASGAGTADVARAASSSLLGVALRAPLADLHIQGGETGEHEFTLDGVPVWNPVSLGRLVGAFSPLALRRLTVRKAGFGAAHGSHLAGVVQAEHALPDGPALRLQADPVSLNAQAGHRLALGGGAEGALMLTGRTSLWPLRRDPVLAGVLRDWTAPDPLLAAVQTGKGLDQAVPLALHRHDADVAFSDWHAAAHVALSPFHRVAASGYLGTSRLATDALALADHAAAPDVLMRGRDRYDWRNLAGQVRHEWLVGARALATLQLRGSRHAFTHGYHMAAMEMDGEAAPGDGATLEDVARRLTAQTAAQPVPDDGNRMTDLGAKAGLDLSLGQRHHLTTSLEVARAATRFHLGTDPFRPLAHRHAAWRVAAHAGDAIALGGGTTLDLGTRLTYLPDRQTLYAEPRLAVRHDGQSRRLGPYAVRLAGGLYRRFIQQFTLSNPGASVALPSLRLWMPTDASLAPPRVVHVAAEATAAPHPAWQIDVEAYWKAQPRLLEIDYPALVAAATPTEADAPLSDAPLGDTQATFVGASRGRAVGGGVRVAYAHGRLAAEAAYAVSLAERTFPGRFDGRRAPTPWNEPHRLTLGARLALTRGPAEGDGLRATARARGVWGRPWDARRAYYDYLAVHSTPALAGELGLDDPAAPGLPPLYRLDLGLAYARTVGAVTLHAEALVVNALDRANVFDYGFAPADGGGFARTPRTLPGRRPVLVLGLRY